MDKKEFVNLFTASGACALRKDLSHHKRITKLQNSKEIVIDKKIRAALFPWDLNKLRDVFGSKSGSYEEMTKRLLGERISVEILNKLYYKSACYERLATNNYKKKN